MRHLLSTLLFIFFVSSSYAQLKLSDFNDFPLGIYFDNYKEIKGYFNKEPELLKGNNKDHENYKITYEKVPFDVYGSADYEFLFINKVLVSIEIEIICFYDQIDKFKQTFESLRRSLTIDNDKVFLSNYGNIKYIDAIKFMKLEGKGVYGRNMEYSDFETLSPMQKSIGKEYWLKRTLAPVEASGGQ